MAHVELKPIAAARFGYLEAQHLLNRAGFGGTPAQIQALASMGLDGAVDYLVEYDAVDAGFLTDGDFDADIMRPLTEAERRELYRARRQGDEKTLAKYRAMRNQAQADDRRQLAALQQWWFERMVATSRPLEEKLTLLWHGHFAVNYRNCEDSYLLYEQNRMFREHATRFDQLVRRIVRDPAMLIFLNNDRNYAAQPNENLARELMELFTLGEGNYSERDIREGARALTGYTREDNAFTFDQAVHDSGKKTIFGRSGSFDGDDFAGLCLAHPACAEYAAYKVYGHFVADVESPQTLSPKQRAIVTDLGRQLRSSRYNLRPMLKTLLKSEHFYSTAVRAAKIKSPAQLVVGLVRQLATPRRDASMLVDAMRMMGQELFNPPNVAGWPGGRSWINTSTLFIRQNVAVYLITGKPPFESDWSRDRMNYEATALIETLEQPTPEAVVDRLSRSLLGAASTDERRRELRQFLADHRDRITNDTLIALLCLITAMPEFQLC